MIVFFSACLCRVSLKKKRYTTFNTMIFFSSCLACTTLTNFQVEKNVDGWQTQESFNQTRAKCGHIVVIIARISTDKIESEQFVRTLIGPSIPDNSPSRALVNIAVQYVELSPKSVLNITLKQIGKHAQTLDASVQRTTHI